MENENDRSFERDPNYADLYSYFEKIFRSHYLSINDYFDGNVWFLSDDSEFYKNKLNQVIKLIIIQTTKYKYYGIRH